MKKSKKYVNIVVGVLVLTSTFSLTGCGKTQSGRPQTETVQQSVNSETQTLENAARQQDIAQAEGEETGGIMREYSDDEKERMQELQQSYQNEDAYPEKRISEVDSAGEVMDGILCYIRSTGEYNLPNRELTDEELLEIIDCNYRLALNANRKTQEEYEAEDWAERTMLEGRVQAMGGISEEKAIEIARKAMQADIGKRGENLKLHIVEEYGWNTYLSDITDRDEYKNRGEIAYFIQFDNVEVIEEWKDLFSYHCVINAIDGSILDAYENHGLGDNTVNYKH